LRRNSKITIITPSFNQGRYLEQTINSIFDQNYPNLEYIIIDGGSTDNSIEIIKKYEKHINYWISKPDKGQSDGINKGLKIAKGEIINWLNSDDYYEKDTFKIINEKFQEPKVKVVCGKSRQFNDKGIVRSSPGTDWYPGNLEKSMGWARIDQPETFFRKSAFDKVGYLNPSLHYLMDREWWIRYLLIFGLDGIIDIEEILVNFRLHDTSKTVSAGKEFQKEHDAIYFALADTIEIGRAHV
jgi:glycosyltransferase involved in cell wall biosynthesis